MAIKNKEEFFVFLFILSIPFLLLLPCYLQMSKTHSLSVLHARTATFAVCESERDYSHCTDKIYASCEKELIEMNETSFECKKELFKVDSESLSEAYWKNWSDPRPKGFITSWAIEE